jgi:excisionase family DNA binding protein
MSSTERLLTVAETARYLRVSESTVYRALADGRIPGSKVLGKWRVDRGELDAWIKQQRPLPGEIDNGEAEGEREPRPLPGEVDDDREGEREPSPLRGETDDDREGEREPMTPAMRWAQRRLAWRVAQLRARRTRTRRVSS